MESNIRFQKNAPLRSKLLIKKIIRRVLYMMKKPQKPTPQLEMVWPAEMLTQPPASQVTEGYILRQFLPEDLPSYGALFNKVGMEPPSLDYWQKHILPNGFFVVEHLLSKTLVGACFASHHPTMRHPRAGNLGWLAIDPAHQGRNLGYAVTAAVTQRLILGGYQHIYLETHDFRIPAIATYLKMGWIPLLYLPEMEQRWKAVCKILDWPYTPEYWPCA